ncbi:Y-box-binding protein 1-like [Portunus trituberculatus]|uniref:Y-box-binding protein 1-like n=1 Tax=Portunus trituberculatus TaxID=210409 RepID=UPI001E1CCB4E|nr:Y-box-binding protein 1-like [Portunus trituberculatus]
MASPVDHPGLVKWYNVKAGCGFIQDLRTGKDVFCHASGLTRSLKDRPPREGDQVLAIREERKRTRGKGCGARRLTSLPRHEQSRSRRDQPGTEAAPNQQAATAAEPEPTGDKPRNRKETQDDVPGEEDDDEEEDEEVDVLGSGSEGEGPSPQASKPNFPSDPQPPSGKQEEDDGWVTKTKRRRRPSPNTLRLVLPKAERTTTPSAALRESPTVQKLRQEKRTGKIREDVLIGVYIHEENRFVGNIKGYTGFPGYMSYSYPKDSSTQVKRS